MDQVRIRTNRERAGCHIEPGVQRRREVMPGCERHAFTQTGVRSFVLFCSVLFCFAFSCIFSTTEYRNKTNGPYAGS